MEPAVSLNHGCSLSNFHIYCQSCYLDFRYQKCYILKLFFFLLYFTERRTVGGFLQVLLISSTNKTEIMLKVVLNTITLTLQITHDLHLMSLRTILNLPPISPCLIYPSEPPTCRKSVTNFIT
jgi:hypothetical protein